VAPVVPLALVAVSFAPSANPAGEAGSAAPVAGLAVVVPQTVAVLVTSLAALAAGALVLPDRSLSAAAWVLPALGLALATLALASWMRIERAAVALAACWFGALTIARWRTPVPVEELTVWAAPGQVAAVLLIAVALAVLVHRRDTFADPRRGR
jgi:hypothetical protein